MFILTVRPSKVKKIMIFTISIILISFTIFTLRTIGNNFSDQNEKNISVSKISKNVKSNEDRVNFLSQFGWEINPEPLEIVDVNIPETFNATYENYNKIQKEQGLDLSKYKGKTCTRFTYQVLNHKDSPKGARANLLVIKNKVIGGDICSVELNGFMHGFSSKEYSEENKEKETYCNTSTKDVLSKNDYSLNEDSLKTTFNENPSPDPDNPAIPVD